MRDELLDYYERELSYLRRSGTEFAKEYPKVAARLQLEPNKCDDPHVERVLEGFAFLAARIHLKIDDDLSEVSEALLSMVAPHYIRPIPSMSLVEFKLDPQQGKLTSRLDLPRGTTLHSRPVRGVPCTFRTCYETSLWPVDVADVAWVSPHQLSPPVSGTQAIGAVRMELRCHEGVTLPQLELDRLRLHLNGESALVATLYELLFNSCTAVLVRPLDPESPTPPVRLPASALEPVGFGRDEGMLPYSRRSFPGYQLIQEYFAFPQKFHFADLTGLHRLPASFGPTAEVIFLIAPFERNDRRYVLEAGVSKETLRLGCTPVVNLFQQTAEPIRLDQRRYEYPVIPDARRRLETGVYSVDEVVGHSRAREATFRYEPFYSYRHGLRDDGGELFWHARRKRSEWRDDEGTDVLISFADLSGRAVDPDGDSVTVRLTCHNGDMPSQLPFGSSSGDFRLEDGIASVGQIRTLTKPTAMVLPPLGKAQLWRLISLLSLNYVSLAGGDPEPLQELLRLYNFSQSAPADREIDGIASVDSRAEYSRVESEYGLGFARGRNVQIEFDEDQFAGGGVYLFASVLERFLGLYASLNSFTVLSARTAQRRGPLSEWPPRAGWKTLV